MGKYKSFVEPFILSKMSNEDREETQKVLGDVWGDFVQTVSDSRKIDPATVQNLVNSEGYILPESALKAKMVDRLCYFGDVLNELGRIAPSGDTSNPPLPFKQVAITDYIHPGSHTPSVPGDKGGNVIAVLYLEGEIVDGQGDTTNIGRRPVCGAIAATARHGRREGGGAAGEQPGRQRVCLGGDPEGGARAEGEEAGDRVDGQPMRPRAGIGFRLMATGFLQSRIR